MSDRVANSAVNIESLDGHIYILNSFDNLDTDALRQEVPGITQHTLWPEDEISLSNYMGFPIKLRFYRADGNSKLYYIFENEGDKLIFQLKYVR